LNAYIACLDDYSIDSRGDIGSWVREEAMESLVDIILLLHGALSTTDLTSYWRPQVSEVIIAKLLRQCFEKIDRVRERAAKSITKLLYPSHTIQISPHSKTEEEIESEDFIDHSVVSKVSFVTEIKDKEQLERIITR
jgi:hypothetical protein